MAPPFSRCSPLAVLFLLAACSTEPSGDLVGTWSSAPEDLQPSGHYQVLLSFTAQGGFEQQVQNYGLYPGQDPNQLSAYTKIRGTYRTEGDRLIVDADRQIWWDPTFYGPDEQEAEDSSTLFDQGRFSLDGDRLVLHYTTYPADAPVPTAMELTRAR
jgi:hypothetical protein